MMTGSVTAHDDDDDDDDDGDKSNKKNLILLQSDGTSLGRNTNIRSARLNCYFLYFINLLPFTMRFNFF